MMPETVNVLISTYNGEKYIGQQIDSILNQSYSDIHIYVRDDGSTDHTVDRLKQYDSNGKLTILEGNNIGYASSFMALLEYAEDGEYWAFCDQDDIWFPDKVQVAVKWLNEHKKVPCLFHSAYENVDENLNTIDFFSTPEYKYDFRRALTECRYSGFSMVINRRLRDLMIRADKKNIVSHDWWAILVAIKFGICHEDSRVMSRHRRLENSVSRVSFQKKLQWLKRGLSEGNPVGNNAKEFYRIFSQDLSSEEEKILRLFCENNLKANLIKAFYPKRWRPTWSSELPFRFLTLMGKME